VKFSIIVSAPPASCQAAFTAYHFARAAISQEHEIYRVFFYGDGVLNANSLSISPQDETNLSQAWDSFLKNNEIDSVACVSSALVRGILSPEESARHKMAEVSLYASTQIAGLGQFVDALLQSDRLIFFG
tara:strand:+ start:101 stop:490 length:390 start_codon:yes stop_codon:yes gene_type:complete